MKRWPLGVIEGFYGRQWRWEQRRELPRLLRDWGYNAYIYAPKGDGSLRSRWRDDFSKEHSARLRSLSEASIQAGIDWGLGLSPAGLQSEFGDQDQRDLRRKLKQIQSLKPAMLWILFDDLPAGVPQLAARQLAVMAVVRDALPEVRLAMCPSYYSDDPILETLFGRCPEGYFEQLANGLGAEVDLLWTGPQVISTEYRREDMHRASELLGRKPLLWDNYPVNDGRKSSRFLNVLPFRGRQPWLKEACSGHFVNPMNAYHLSFLSLQGLPAGYEQGLSPDEAFKSALMTLPAELAEVLVEYADVFQRQGLDGMPTDLKSVLALRCDGIDHPAAAELAGWLREEYRFDPDCLTE